MPQAAQNIRPDMIRFQALHHEIVTTETFATVEDLVGYLMHAKAYDEAISMVKGAEVLDLGCNVGYGAALLRPHCARVIAVDVNEAALAEARKRYGDRDIAFRAVDGRRLPFADESFDVVVSFQVIEHVPDPDQFLGEIRRVLRRGGRAVLTTPNAAVRLEPGKKPWNPFHVQEFTAHGLRELLSRHFDETTILGMYGTDAVQRIELARVTRARQAEWVRPDELNQSMGDRLRSSLRRAMPGALLRFIRRTRAAMRSGNGTPSLPDYTIAELSYRREGLDGALDFMAICTSR